MACGVYLEGTRIADVQIDEAGKSWREPDHVVWIGLYEPDLELLQRLQNQFGLHPLAIEDAGRAHQRPKIEQYGESLFIVARTAQIVDSQIAYGETHLFVGHGFVISVRHGASTSYSAVRERSESSPKMLSHGEDYILYAILDFIVDNYVPVIEAVHAEVDQIEDAVLDERSHKSDVKRLYNLRRDLLRLRDAVVPLVEVCRRLEHAEVKSIDPPMQPLFRDVTDHVRRVQEEIDSLRELLAFAFEAESDDGSGATKHHCSPPCCVGRYSGSTDGGCRDLWDEFLEYARTSVAIRVLRGDRRNSRDLRLPLLAVPKNQMLTPSVSHSG